MKHGTLASSISQTPRCRYHPVNVVCSSWLACLRVIQSIVPPAITPATPARSPRVRGPRSDRSSDDCQQDIRGEETGGNSQRLPDRSLGHPDVRPNCQVALVSWRARRILRESAAKPSSRQ